MQRGTSSWCSFILSAYQETAGTFYITLDGTHGADFSALLEPLRQACEKEGIPFSSDFTAKYVKPEGELRSEMAAYLTDNRAFGYKANDIRPMRYFRNDAKAFLEKKHLNMHRVAGYMFSTDQEPLFLPERNPISLSLPTIPVKTNSCVMPSGWVALASANRKTKSRPTSTACSWNGPYGSPIAKTG